jgi:hypothetical protein
MPTGRLHFKNCSAGWAGDLAKAKVQLKENPGLISGGDNDGQTPLLQSHSSIGRFSAPAL